MSVSVFPGLVSDVDNFIFSFLDNQSQVVFSGVSQIAYKKLSNNVHFHNLFKIQHPQLTGHCFSFVLLAKYHPSNCWKVACCCFSKGVFRVNKSFLELAIPSISLPLKEKKMRLETELNQLCGVGFADPNSLIDQAWKFHEKCTREFDEVNTKFCSSLELLSSMHPEVELKVLCGVSRDNPNKFSLGDEGAVGEGFSDEELKTFKPHLFALYQEFANLYVDYSSKLCDLMDSDTKYRTLEKKRCSLGSELIQVNKDLDLMIPDYELSLNSEFRLAMDIELALVNVDKLVECSKLLVELQSKVPTSEDLRKASNLINSCSLEVKTMIWNQLYFNYGMGNQDPSWAENHFHEFLGPLSSIIKGSSNHYQAILLQSHSS